MPGLRGALGVPGLPRGPCRAAPRGHRARGELALRRPPKPAGARAPLHHQQRAVIIYNGVLYNGAPFNGALYIMVYYIMVRHLMVRYI